MVIQRKNILILAQNTDNHFASRVKDEAIKLGKNLYILNAKSFDLPLEVTLKNKLQLPPPSETVIWNRVSGSSYNDYDLMVTESWQKLGAELLNSLKAHETYRNKFKQFMHLKNAKLPVPETYYLPQRSIELISGSGPFVVKTERGSMGKGVIRIQDKSSLADFLTLCESIGDTRFIVQEFIDYEIEERVFVCNGEIVGHLLKERSCNSWKHSLSKAIWKRGKEVSIELQSLISPIDDLERKFFYAIDFIKKGNDYIVLEVNLCPGLQGPASLGDNTILKRVLRSI